MDRGMADKPLFNLDPKGRWRLAFDSNQWIIQRRVGKPLSGRSDSSAGATSGWKAVSSLGGRKATLERLFGEKEVVLAPEAIARLDALPEQFMDVIVAPDRFAAQWQKAA